MRISTANSYDSSIETLQRRQQEMSEAQQRLISGKRVAKASDDPSAAARAERALALQARIDATKRAVDASRDMTALTESALGQAGELLQQARELVVAAGNPGYDDAQRRDIAGQLRRIRDQLLSVANQGDGGGGYLFGGQGSSQPPFVEGPAGVAFRGTGGRLEVAGHEALPLSADGGSIWLSAPTGNGAFATRALPANVGSAVIDNGRTTDAYSAMAGTYDIVFAVDAAGNTTWSASVTDAGGTVTPLATAQPYKAGQAIEIDGMSVTLTGKPADGDGFQLAPSAPTLDVFGLLGRVAGELETGGRSGSQIAQTNLHALADVDTVMGRLLTARSAAGEALNRIDRVTGQLDERKLNAEVERSAAEDLDLVEAISTFSGRQNGYDAALKSYAMVQRLSLFQYLNV